MNNPFNSGTLDDYYEGDKDCLWVEYKYLPKQPTRCFTPSLTELQKRWARRAWKNGRPTLVIVGSPKGGYILRSPDSWENQVQVKGLTLHTRKEIAKQIELITCTQGASK